MPVKPQLRNASCITRGDRTRSVKSMKARPPWTGWNRSRSAASRLRRPRRPLPGKTCRSTSSTRRATSTSRLKSSGRCACWMARSPCSTRSPVCSRSRKRFGGRRTSIRFRAFASSTRWTGWARISSIRWIRSWTGCGRGRCRFRFRWARKRNSRALSIWWK